MQDQFCNRITQRVKVRSLLYVVLISLIKIKDFFYIVSRLLFSIIGMFETSEIDSSHCKLSVKLENSMTFYVASVTEKVSGKLTKLIAVFLSWSIFVAIIASPVVTDITILKVYQT